MTAPETNGETFQQAEDNPNAAMPKAPASPRLDPEAMLLSSLLAVSHNGSAANQAEKDADYVLNYFHENDFANPIYGRIFSLMVAQREQGKLITPAALSARISATADTNGWGSTTPELRLLNLYELGALTPQILYYADEVLGSSYRRQFSAMVTNLAQATEHAAEDDLFTLLVSHGRAQRNAWARRTSFYRNLEPATADNGDDRNKDEN